MTKQVALVTSAVAVCLAFLPMNAKADAGSTRVSGAPIAAQGHDFASRGSYYDWGRAMNGWGYCYEYTFDGWVLNGGAPVPNYLCERTRPSYYGWGRSMNGYVRCYQFTAYGVVMNEGQPVPNYLCR